MQVHQGMQYGTPAASMYQPQQYMPIPQHQQNEQLRQFWIQQHREVQEVGTDPAEFKNHQLPLARIKKVGHSPSDHHHCTKAFHLLTIFVLPMPAHMETLLLTVHMDGHQCWRASPVLIAADHEER